MGLIPDQKDLKPHYKGSTFLAMNIKFNFDITGAPITRTFTLAFGGTALTLAQAETASMATATTKARRIVVLPELTQHITAAQAVNTAISQPSGAICNFINPIYVNPG